VQFNFFTSEDYGNILTNSQRLWPIRLLPKEYGHLSLHSKEKFGKYEHWYVLSYYECNDGCNLRQIVSRLTVACCYVPASFIYDDNTC
jgi:hypothetical protein